MSAKFISALRGYIRLSLRLMRVFSLIMILCSRPTAYAGQFR